MHLFYRILCLIQFAQMRAARPWNYGLDKEIVLLTGILHWKGDGQKRIVPTHSFSYSCHQPSASTYSSPAVGHGAGTARLQHSPVEVADIRTDGYNTLAGSITHTGPGGYEEKHRGEEDFLCRLKLRQKGRMGSVSHLPPTPYRRELPHSHNVVFLTLGKGYTAVADLICLVPFSII